MGRCMKLCVGIFNVYAFAGKGLEGLFLPIRSAQFWKALLGGGFGVFVFEGACRPVVGSAIVVESRGSKPRKLNMTRVPAMRSYNFGESLLGIETLSLGITAIATCLQFWRIPIRD